MSTSKTKSALGKGMGALLGAGSSPLAGIKQDLKSGPIEPKNNDGSILLPITKLRANKDQPRKIFKDRELLELSASIKENGIIQPITVQLNEDNQYIIIAGERRFRAAKLAGLESVPVVVKVATKKEVLVMAIIENVQRSDLNCVEEALAYYQLMNEFNITQEEVAKKVGKDRSSIANFLRILKLPREVIQSLQKEDISFGHAKVLASVKEDEACKRFSRIAIEENMSVRDLEKLIKSKKSNTTKTANKFFDEKLDGIKSKLESKTGFHFDLKTKPNGSGMISIKFSNEAEFNDVYTYLASK
jgi:ParB family chromosome partitioning protein